ncbi:MAG: Fur family transcriptional regulator [Chloroflexota bacterium]|jgi:Fur family ferric uptake transcriptional regulator
MLSETQPHAREVTWDEVRERLHERGLRWTPQRRLLVDVLAGTDGHITGAELVERCREQDPEVNPSTVYRTLDVLEDIGLIRHAHGLDGREEFHVRPAREHGHMHCSICHRAWEIGADDVADLVADFERTRGFRVDLGHLSVVGICRACREDANG